MSHVIFDPYPQTLGMSSLTICVPQDFRGDAEICWYTDVREDKDEHQILCSASALLQGLFRDVRGTRPSALFDARVVALVLHEFYRVRIEAAARLEVAYQWQPYARDDHDRK